MSDAKELTKHVTNKAVALIKAIHNPPVGAKEFSGGWCPERCDALLFDSNNSFMIETKISRSDFLADFKKAHRQEGGLIGNYRYYACPEGLISVDELPEKWGLIYVNPDIKRARASMPVGFGGSIRTPHKNYKCPIKGWTIETFDYFGSPRLKDKDFPDMDWKEVWEHPEQPHNKFYFPDTGLERNYLFALATRYKQQKFMDNML